MYHAMPLSMWKYLIKRKPVWKGKLRSRWIPLHSDFTVIMFWNSCACTDNSHYGEYRHASSRSILETDNGVDVKRCGRKQVQSGSAEGWRDKRPAHVVMTFCSGSCRLAAKW